MTKLQSALLATATFALGAATIQGLHAQMKPLGYFISTAATAGANGEVPCRDAQARWFD